MPQTANQEPSTPVTLEWRDVAPEFAPLLTDEAKAFVAELAGRFTQRRNELLKAREAQQKAFDEGALPDFLPETQKIRDFYWQVTVIPEDLQDRRVEITGPVERKMIINALNSGAKCFMADLEDSHAPEWNATLQGQVNLYDAVRRQIDFVAENGKHYQLNDNPAVLIVRPRGWHLPEKHVLLDGQPIPGALLDFGLYFFHNAKELLNRGSGPYFYLPKLEHYHEAALWRDIFAFAEEYLGIPRQSIKATVLIETITATFQLNEILHALREYCVALNCGRWDYIFSYIKKLRNHPDRMLPERGQVTMTTPFMRNYSRMVIETCHRRGAFAMGGMAAQIPIKGDVSANDVAMAKVRADKEREVTDGHDGTWVAHPGLVPVAMEVFDQHMLKSNQLSKPLQGWNFTQAQLLEVPEGSITEAGLRNNITVAIRYLAAWLGGNGCVPIFNLMEDAATAEISRAQLWQWCRHGAKLEGGEVLTPESYCEYHAEEVKKLRDEVGDHAFVYAHYERAAEMLEGLVLNKEFTEFLTLPAYETFA